MSSQDVIGQVKEAQSLHRQGKSADADAAYRRVLELDSQNAFALHGLGLLASAAGHHEQAADWLERSVRVRPGDAHFRNNLALGYASLKRFADAEREFTRAIELRPDLAGTYANLGMTLREMNRLPDAAAALERAVELNPRDVAVIRRLGQIREQAGDLAGVLQCAQRLVAAAPSEANHHYSLGAALAKLSRPREAIFPLRTALSLDPRHLGARHSLAAQLSVIGDKAEAIRLLQETLQMFPDSNRARFDLAVLTGQTAPTPPPEYIVGLFDEYADSFDQHLGQLGYRAPDLLFAAVRGMRPSEKLDILDIGCGTGQAAVTFQPILRSIVGIDIAPKMIEKSRARGIYTELICADLNTAMRAFESCFDLVIALDVFVYVGDAEATVRDSVRALRPGGFFGFSVEKHDGEGFILLPTQRYAHSTSYLSALAGRAGFEIVDGSDFDLRMEKGAMTPGHISVWRKPTSA